MKRSIPRLFAAFCLSLATLPASAGFHLWNFNEVYTNADGTIQFIELTTGFGFQQFVSLHTLTATSGVTTHTYNVMTDLPSDSTNKRFLFGTAAFAALNVATPDFIIPNNFLFPGGGTLNWAGFDSWTYGPLSTDGDTSLNRSGVTGPNSPTNFAGTTGHIQLLDPLGDADGDGIPNAVEAVEGRSQTVKDNDVFGVPRLFTMQQYRDFLGREGDAAGIQGWVDFINAGTYDRLQVVDAFLSSNEFAGFVAPVVRLYFATFLRVPDYAGLTFNAGLLKGTINLAQLADFFTQSPEFQATYGSLNDTQFVTLLYNNVLNRAPDTAGLNGWVALLQGVYTRGQVLIGFSESAEYMASSANKVFVTMMYTGMLHRTPEQAGFDGWVGFLGAATLTRTQVINGFFLSTEYHGRFLP
jgi:Domain of unknown function (DUF4214)